MALTAAAEQATPEASPLARSGESYDASSTALATSMSSSAGGGSSNETAAASPSCSSIQQSSSTDSTVSSSGSVSHPLPPAARAAIARAAAARHAAARQAAIANRIAGVRARASRCASASAGTAAEQQGMAVDSQSDAGDALRGRCGSGSASVANSEISPTGKGGKHTRALRSGGDGASASGVATAEAANGSRSLRRAPSDANSTAAAQASTSHTPAGGLATAEEPLGAMDYRGLRRSLRQALLATSGKANTSTTAAGCITAAAESHGGSGAGGPAGAAGGVAACPGGAGGLAVGANAPTGRRRMRQPQRQMLQTYTVGQQHQQVGPQEEGQEATECLAEWLGIESNVPCCCCGSGCLSCSATCGGKCPATAGSSISNQSGPGYVTRAGTGAGARSALDVYTAAATKRQKVQQQQQPMPQDRTSDSSEDIVFGPSWFDLPTETESPVELCIVRPTSPSRNSAFLSEQKKWEAQDRLDSFEAAETTVGTPWPKGSTSCSFGGYAAATRNGGVVPLCCYCGLPLRPPAAGGARGAGAESGCPLIAAAAAVAHLGLEGWTQWCRCCTRVYGDLRLQHQRDAAWLPFTSFVVPKGPLRYVLLPADGAKDTPGGAGAISAAVAAAAAADPRRARAAEEGAGVCAEGDSEAAAANLNGNSGNNNGSSASARRTRSGQHFARAAPARSSGRNNNNPTDIMRFRSASCCWPSNTSKGSFIQPIARLQQHLTQLQQQYADPQHQQAKVSQDKASVSGLTPPTAAAAGVAAGQSTSVSPATSNSATATIATAAGDAVHTAAAEMSPATSTSMPKAAAAPGAAGSDDPGSVVGDKTEAAASLASADPSSVKAASPSTAAVPDEAERSSSPQLGPTAAGGESSQAAPRAVVVPRVFLESSTSCYVATAFDAARLQLLQKRFSCLILGEQRAHALACQWLRWVHRCCSASLVKQKLLRCQGASAPSVQAETPAPNQTPDCAAPAGASASPCRKLMAGGLSGGRRGPQRSGTSTQIHQQEGM